MGLANQNAVTAKVGPSGCGNMLRVAPVHMITIKVKSLSARGYKILISTARCSARYLIVFQNVELFNTSVMENIRLGRKDALVKRFLQLRSSLMSMR